MFSSIRLAVWEQLTSKVSHDLRYCLSPSVAVFLSVSLLRQPDMATVLGVFAAAAALPCGTTRSPMAPLPRHRFPPFTLPRLPAAAKFYAVCVPRQQFQPSFFCPHRLIIWRFFLDKKNRKK